MAYRQLVIVQILCCFALLLPLTGCTPTSSSTSSSEPTLSRRVVVTNYPLFEFTNRIVGSTEGEKSIRVEYVGPGRNSETDWAPATEQIREFQKADLVIVNGPGAQFANWLTFVTVDKSKLCKTADVLDLLEFIVVKEFKVVHSHGPEGEHSHDWVVPNCWLDPSIAKRQAAEIVRRLSEVYPDRKAEFENNVEQLNQDFDVLTDEIQALESKVKTWPTKLVVTSDPRLKFLTRAVGLDDQSLLWFEPVDDAQAKSDVESMEKSLDQKKPIAFMWGSDDNELAKLNSSTTNALSENSISIDPIESQPKQGDYFSAMKANLQKLAALVNP